jgi:hypothetical protein
MGVAPCPSVSPLVSEGNGLQNIRPQTLVLPSLLDLEKHKKVAAGFT